MGSKNANLNLRSYIYLCETGEEFRLSRQDLNIARAMRWRAYYALCTSSYWNFSEIEMKQSGLITDQRAAWVKWYHIKCSKQGTCITQYRLAMNCGPVSVIAATFSLLSPLSRVSRPARRAIIGVHWVPPHPSQFLGEKLHWGIE